MKCDLHTHTVHSDGSFTPTELVREAKKQNLIIALTDHNTTSGLSEFMNEAERLDVVAVAGSELSCDHEGREFHLLGLFLKPEYYEAVEAICAEFISLKEKSNIDLVEKLKVAGYDIDYERVKTRNIKGNANRAHIAAELVERGYMPSVQEAFERLLDPKNGLYIPPKRPTLIWMIGYLRSIGAVPVLAHPLKEIGEERLREILPELKAAGLVAIETMHSSYDEEKIALSKRIAKEFNLLESGGSDFHGSIKPGVALRVGRGNIDIDEMVYLRLKEKV